MSSLLLPHWRYLWLVAASFLAGAINAMAGGGSFISFPAMLALGVPPVEANATNTVALWPGQLTSAVALRSDLRPDLHPGLIPVLLATSLVGGTAGAEILLHTSQRTFTLLIPWLLLAGALLFWISAPVSKWLRRRAGHPSAPHQVAILPLALALLPVAFYVGYFGAGSGFLIMTALALFGLEDIRQLNALKVVAAGASNLCAVVVFILSGRILWHFCLISMLFAALGGFAGARYTRRINPAVLRSVVILTGLTIAAYFFWKQR